MSYGFSLVRAISAARASYQHFMLFPAIRGFPVTPPRAHGPHHHLLKLRKHALCALPFVTFKIVAAIHWQALLLWLKGAPLAPRPNAAAVNPASNTGLATGEPNDYTGARRA
jgi:hypothetical protein